MLVYRALIERRKTKNHGFSCRIEIVTENKFIVISIGSNFNFARAARKKFFGSLFQIEIDIATYKKQFQYRNCVEICNTTISVTYNFNFARDARSPKIGYNFHMEIDFFLELRLRFLRG